MLVLSRCPGEELIIAGQIRIRVIRTVGKRVTIGIDAPKEITVRRGEHALQISPQANGADPTSKVSLSVSTPDTL